MFRFQTKLCVGMSYTKLRIFTAVLCCILLSSAFMISCGQQNDPPPEYNYTETDKDLKVNVGNAVTVNHREGYELSVTRISVLVEGKQQITDTVNRTLDTWLADGVEKSDRFYASIKDVLSDLTSLRLKNEITFNANGILSAVCRLEYSYYGEDFLYVLNSATWDLGDQSVIPVLSMLSMTEADYENFLTMYFQPSISTYPDNYPSSLNNASGCYSKFIDYYINDKGICLYLNNDLMDYSKSYLEYALDFKNNPGMFRYDLETFSD